MNVFEEANERIKIKKNEMRQQTINSKSLTPSQEEVIKQKHWSFLNKIEAVVLDTDIFSAKEKHEILNEMDNRIDFAIESEIFVETTKLNKN